MEGIPPGVNPSTIPLAPNPNGGPPNFEDPPSLDSAVLGVGVTLIIISSLLVTLRLTTNFKNTGRLGLDDYLCLLAELGGIGYWAIIQSLVPKGAARHTWDVPITIVDSSFIKLQFAQQTIIGPVLWASKAAILALYIRLFGTVRWLRLTAYGLITFMFLFYCSNAIIAAVYCIPRGGAPWDATAFERCASPVALLVVIGVFGVVADLALFVLPFPVIYTLHVRRPRKIGLAVVFLVAFLTVITSVASLGYRVAVFQGEDPVWNGVNVAITTVAEVFGTVIVSCAPAMSSFWLYIVTNSKLYSSLRSSLASFSAAGRSGDRRRKAGSSASSPVESSIRHHNSNSILKHSGHHDSQGSHWETRVSSSPSEKLQTRIYSSRGEHDEKTDAITRSIQIEY